MFDVFINDNFSMRFTDTIATTFGNVRVTVKAGLLIKTVELTGL